MFKHCCSPASDVAARATRNFKTRRNIVPVSFTNPERKGEKGEEGEVECKMVRAITADQTLLFIRTCESAANMGCMVLGMKAIRYP